ncbi:MAG TPA: hypothetical protein DCR04_12230 [Flavobacteriales bacterium]|nr:hypothetical protein [Flavobacteriales bacterium]
MKNPIWIAVFMACVLSSCDKLTEISEVPEIAFESVVPNVVTEYQDSLYFTLSYRDGNGDLGQNNTDENNLFIQDSRNQVTYGFRIQQLAPDNSDIAIQGNLNVTLPNAAIINGGASESVSYTIWVVDRAGNESNRVNSSTVTVNAE